MNWLKRGIISVRRRWSKSLILFIIIFVLGNMISGAISIVQAVGNTEKNIRNQMTPIATIISDEEKVNELYQKYGENYDFSPVSLDVIKQIGELPSVKYFDYSISTNMESSSLKLPDETPDSGEAEDVVRYFRLTGVQNPELTGIMEGKIRLVSGRTFSEKEISDLSYKAIISQKFADVNELTVGSKFKMTNVVYDEFGMTLNSRDCEFEVIGIFEPQNLESNEYAIWNECIYVTNEVAKECLDFSMGGSSNQDVTYENLYVLDDPQHMEEFKELAETLIPEYCTVADTGDSYESVAGPINTLKWISSVILYVSAGAAILIISLLTTLFLRDRKCEIGIYMAMGERKIRIICQIMAEVMVVAILAMILSLFSGNVLSRSISQETLNAQLASAQESDRDYGKTELEAIGYGEDISFEELRDNYQITLETSTIALFFATGIFTVLVSTIIPVIYITRLNPKKILMN